MYRAQMTDTELEEYYMQGEFKPSFTYVLHPKHMTDSELDELFKMADEGLLSESLSTALIKEFILRLPAVIKNVKESK